MNKPVKLSDVIQSQNLVPTPTPSEDAVTIIKTTRTKKKVEGTEITRSRKGHARTNLPVKLPDNPTWIKQPNIITLMSYDFNTLNIRVLITVIEKIQTAVEESIQHFVKKDGIGFEQLALFEEY